MHKEEVHVIRCWNDHPDKFVNTCTRQQERESHWLTAAKPSLGKIQFCQKHLVKLLGSGGSKHLSDGKAGVLGALAAPHKDGTSESCKIKTVEIRQQPPSHKPSHLHIT